MKLFIDTNVLLDVLLGREEFLEDSSTLWACCEKELAEGYVSAISFNNAHYIISKLHSKAKADEAARALLDTFHVVPLDAKTLSRALDAKFKDFEDAIQFFSALHADADYLITRDVDGFPRADIAALTPAEFLSMDMDWN